MNRLDALVNDLKHGIGGQTPEAPIVGDETMPGRLMLMFYALLVVMAWRTADILYLTLPKSYIGYALLAFTLMAIEGGSLVWHHVHGLAARGKEQERAAFWGFGMDFTFSIVTTVADITSISGIQALNMDQLQPFAMLASGLIVIANVGLIFYYDWNSPVKSAARETARKQFEFKQRQADEARQLAETEAEINARSTIVTRREELAQETLVLAKREQQLAKVLDQAGGVVQQTAKTPSLSASAQRTGPEVVATGTNGNGNGHGSGETLKN